MVKYFENFLWLNVITCFICGVYSLFVRITADFPEELGIYLLRGLLVGFSLCVLYYIPILIFETIMTDKVISKLHDKSDIPFINSAGKFCRNSDSLYLWEKRIQFTKDNNCIIDFSITIRCTYALLLIFDGSKSCIEKPIATYHLSGDTIKYSSAKIANLLIAQLESYSISKNETLN